MIWRRPRKVRPECERAVLGDRLYLLDPGLQKGPPLGLKGAYDIRETKPNPETRGGFRL